MDLWDTAGQEKYRAIGRHFYKESYIVCLVYDITSKDSFKNLQDVWYPELLEYGEKYKIIALIGNKVDRYLEETVSEEEGKKFAAKINAVYKRTSALKGIGLDDLFNEQATSPSYSAMINENNNNSNEGWTLDEQEVESNDSFDLLGDN